MIDFALLLLLFSAIAIGWVLGRRAQAGSLESAAPSSYYQGLQFLLDGQGDPATDAFIDKLEINEDTLETHLALGVLMRKRGETDRAIRIHQRLLALGKLSRRQLHQAHLELARDYLSAGLLDRAERLLKDLAEQSPECRAVALRQLLDLYQGERDWDQAIVVGERLLSLDDPQKEEADRAGIRVLLGHFCCEMALARELQGDDSGARAALQRALSFDSNSVRASLHLGQIAARREEYSEALRALRRVRLQDADFVPETIRLIGECYAATGNPAALKDYLDECIDYRPRAELLVAKADLIESEAGTAAALDFLADEMTRNPSLLGVAALLALQQRALQPMQESTKAVVTVQTVVGRLLAQQLAYRCQDCGFVARQLHWQCPGCRHWGTIRPQPVRADER